MSMLRQLAPVLALALGAALASAPAPALQEGVDYDDLDPAQALPAPGEPIKVTEFFNFSCPACNQSQPHVESFLAKNHGDVTVDWVRTPVPFERWGGLYARAFFVLEAFGRTDLVPELFAALHGQRRLLNSEGRISAWLAEEHGLDEAKAEQAFGSFAIDTKMRRTERVLRQLGVSSTPTFIVADRFRMRNTGSYATLFAAIEELLAKINRGELQPGG